MNLDFLQSNRFIAILLGAVVIYLHNKGYIGKDEMVLIEAIIAPFVVVGTADKVAEKIGGKKKA